MLLLGLLGLSQEAQARKKCETQSRSNTTSYGSTYEDFYGNPISKSEYDRQLASYNSALRKPGAWTDSSGTVHWTEYSSGSSSSSRYSTTSNYGTSYNTTNNYGPSYQTINNYGDSYLTVNNFGRGRTTVNDFGSSRTTVNRR